MIPMGGNVVRPNPKIVDTYPDYYLNMGLTAENLAQKYEITGEQADEFSLQSHQKAAAAIKEGRFKEEIVPVTVRVDELDEKGEGASARSHHGPHLNTPEACPPPVRP